MTMKCKKFLVSIFVFVFVFTGFFSLGVDVQAFAADDIRNIVSGEDYNDEDNYLTVYTQDGEMQDVPIPEQVEQDTILI